LLLFIFIYFKRDTNLKLNKVGTYMYRLETLTGHQWERFYDQLHSVRCCMFLKAIELA